MLLVKRANVQPDIDPGRYVLRLTDAEEISFEDKGTAEEVTKLKLHFEVVGGKHAGKRFNDLFTPLISDGSKLGNLLDAVSGGGLPEDGGDEVDLEPYVGRVVSARIDQKKSGYLGLVSGSCEPTDAPPF